MTDFNRENHWENIYKTKDFKEVSWYQSVPKISLDFVKLFNVPNTAKIIDVGGGDCFFVDCLLDMGYENITVLDISAMAIDRAKKRLGDRANLVKWIVSDVVDFKPKEKYDFWHDRAVFHFLTDEKEISDYINTAFQSINNEGILVIGTFSENGPKKCSGIKIKQYSETSLSEKFEQYFEKINSITVDHETPFDTKQNFVFCSFEKPAVG